MSGLGSWWCQPDQFDEVTTFLRVRGVLGSARVIMAVVAASASLVPFTELISAHNRAFGGWGMAAVGAAFCLAMTCFWAQVWPTRRQSTVLVILGSICVAGFSVAQSSPSLAALACTAMAVTGGYMAFFHNVKLLLGNLLCTVVLGAMAVWRLAAEADLTTAVAAFWLIWFLNVTVPLAIRASSRAMLSYALRADRDPLTGLLNRRGFIDAISARVSNPAPAATHLMLVMVDLDNFKRVNDTHGHPAGDRVLREVAQLLRAHCPTAVICRAGGEEFLIAHTCGSDDAEQVAVRLCAAIAELPDSITASIGTTSAELHTLNPPGNPGLIEGLIESADAAMYAAKRNGGNQAQHTVPPADETSTTTQGR